MKYFLLFIGMALPLCSAAGRRHQSRTAQEANETPARQYSFGYVDLPPLSNDADSSSFWPTGNVDTGMYTQSASSYDLPPPDWQEGRAAHPLPLYDYDQQSYAGYDRSLHPDYRQNFDAYSGYGEQLQQGMEQNDSLLNPTESYRPTMDPSVFYGTQTSSSSYGSYPQPPWQETQYDLAASRSATRHSKEGSSVSLAERPQEYDQNDVVAHTEEMSRLSMDVHSPSLAPIRTSTSDRAGSRIRRAWGQNLIGVEDHEEIEDDATPQTARAAGSSSSSSFESDTLSKIFTPHPAYHGEEIQREQNRMLMKHEWEERGMSTAMDPNELAEEMAEIKINHPDSATSIGNFASRIVKALTGTHNPAYYREYSKWTHIYTSKINGLRTAFSRDYNFSPEQLRQALLANFRNLDPEVPLTVPHANFNSEEEQLGYAAVIWEDFVRTRLGPAYQPGLELPFPLIAAEFKTYQYGPLTQWQTIKYLRKFMLRVLQITPKQMVRLGNLQRGLGVSRRSRGGRLDKLGAQTSRVQRTQGM